MKRVWTIALLGLLAASIPITAGAAPREKVDKVTICHFNADFDVDAPTWELLEIKGGAKNLAAHIGHGDAHPGDPVPGNEGFEFDDDCTPIPTFSGDVCAFREGRGLSRPRELTLTLGDELTTDTDTSQPDGKYDVGPIVNELTGNTLLVRVSGDANPDELGEVYFGGSADLGASFTAATIGGSDFRSDVYVHLFAPNGAPLQTIKIHTSCSAPIVIGDQFGSVSLTGAVLIDGDTGNRIVLPPT
jgi:hypothetical protein